MSNLARTATSKDENAERLEGNAAFRRYVGWLVTVSWIGGSILWMLIFSKDEGLAANAWGDVFAGLAAPVAFLWLVLGYLQQGDELRQSSQALAHQVSELKDSVEQQKQLVLASAKALEASTEHTRTLVQIERPYLTGGGPAFTTLFGRHFRLEAANYGKTPAYLRAYGVRFATLSEVMARPPEDLQRIPYEDWIPQTITPRQIRWFDVPQGKEVVYGAFWYQDWEKREHIFRFILVVKENTYLGLGGVDDSYRYWD